MMVQKSRKIKVTVYTDGRPGHEKQSRALVTALGRYLSLELCWVKVSKPTGMGMVFEVLNYFLGGGTASLRDHTELLIGTGSATHLPILRHKQVTSAKAVICMSPPRYLRSSFDLCLVPSHDRVTVNTHCFQTTGPPNLYRNQGKHDPTTGLILIGGPNAATKKWTGNHLEKVIRQIVQSQRKTRWHISSSPRTPAAIEKHVQMLCAQIENTTFFPYQATPKGWVEAQYQTAGVVWVTADSISMVFEALSAGCRVGVIPVPWKRRTNKFIRSIRSLEDQGRIFSGTAGLDQPTDNMPEMAPLNEADRCAREMVKRWWSKN